MNLNKLILTGFILALVLVCTVEAFAQVSPPQSFITEIRVTRSDTSQTLVYSETFDKSKVDPLAPDNTTKAKNQATAWYYECNGCRVYVRTSYYLYKLSSASSSRSSSSSVSSSSVVSSSKSSVSSSIRASSSSSKSSSVGTVEKPYISFYRPTERMLLATDEDGVADPLPIEEISHYEVWYDDTNYDIIPSTGDYMEYTITVTPKSGQRYRLYAFDTDKLSSPAAYIDVL